MGSPQQGELHYRAAASGRLRAAALNKTWLSEAVRASGKPWGGCLFGTSVVLRSRAGGPQRPRGRFCVRFQPRVFPGSRITAKGRSAVSGERKGAAERRASRPPVRRPRHRGKESSLGGKEAPTGSRGEAPHARPRGSASAHPSYTRCLGEGPRVGHPPLPSRGSRAGHGPRCRLPGLPGTCPGRSRLAGSGTRSPTVCCVRAFFCDLHF